MKPYTQAAILLLFVILASCEDEENQVLQFPEEISDDIPETIFAQGLVEIRTVATGFNIPWAIEVIDNEDFLCTDRTGKLYHYQNGELFSINNIPQSYSFTPANNLVLGGLMDISLHPEFSSNKLVYISYVANDQKLTVARFKLQGDNAENVEMIFKANGISVGSRISWENDTHFFVSVGMGGDPFPEPGAQDLLNDRGKIHRLMEDGRIPTDNPILSGTFEPSSIWSFGHRNPQGMHYDKTNQVLYSNEHGPLGGDELNVIIKGENYGWPLFSHGLNYNFSPVSFMTEIEALETTVLPIKYWGYDLRVSPSGLLKLEDSNFKSWNGSFLMGSLYPQNLLRYNPETDETEIVLEKVGRVRDVAQLPDGDLLISIDSRSPSPSDSGRILRLSPR
ncbi:PQQ-dependent sugar dehydrogenase [Croceitalea rosinachiae]|uniref:PQQ-dependent sugar dehydrogenase n=1 Tax=Croceitalea rosinachiae TaxID=3075596 RepID=A0ABU3A6V9_9FLAO|nr:PQQ-dependent sugar dehydrogenase [Croceitalea sp. F388]MDT0605570.1 PQQ-dependent sugar dehydrogenase [Croceitalea sp. F388]